MRAAINSLCQLSLGPSAPLQAAVPTILAIDDRDWLSDVMNSLECAARTCAERVSKIKGLSTASSPEGAMYVLVKLDLDAFRGCSSDVLFAEELLAEESVLVLPGDCFNASGFVRIVTTIPESVLHAAWDRIESFCTRRFIESNDAFEDNAHVLSEGQLAHVSLPRVASYLGGHEGLLLKPPTRK